VGQHHGDDIGVMSTLAANLMLLHQRA
jgi:hypothetical protein